MSDAEKIKRVKALCGSTDIADTDIATVLDIAKDKLLEILYQFDNMPNDPILPKRYDGLHCELASRYLARRGGNGEIQHNENGISRLWDSPDDRDILGKVRPYCKVV